MKTRPTFPKQSRDDVVLPIVNAISEEMHLLGCEIAELGEALSKACEPQISPALSRHLQLFDTICQRALTQARLLRGIGILLSDNRSDAASLLKTLIEDVPFEQDRQRLIRAAGGPARAPTINDAGRVGELDWF